MADSTVNDVSKMKVVDLRKELKSRGLSYVGDKAELVARLQAAMIPVDHGDITLDSDEIDSDGVLEDEDDKSHTDILDDTGVDNLNDELTLADQTLKSPEKVKPPRTLKRKITSDNAKGKTPDTTLNETKEVGMKKIVLNRTISVPSSLTKTDEEVVSEEKHVTESPSSNRIKITADIDTKSKLEMRAKRFGLPIKMSEAERKEARKQRFGQDTKVTSKSVTSLPSNISENFEKLKKRAERFGQSVSKIMTDIENKEKLEKRKAKFGVTN